MSAEQDEEPKTENEVASVHGLAVTAVTDTSVPMMHFGGGWMLGRKEIGIRWGGVLHTG